MFSKFTNSFLNDFEPESLFRDNSQITFRSFEKEEVLFSAGEAIDKVYFILQGKADIITTVMGSTMKISTAGSGDIIGISGIYYDYVHSSTAVTTEFINAIEVSKEYFLNMTKTNHEFRLWLLKYFSRME